MTPIGETVEECSPVVNKAPKRTLKEILKGYRLAGLPSSKKFRKRTRVARLENEKEWLLKMVQRAAVLNAQATHIIQSLVSESNFAVHETVEGTPGIIEWVADDTALEAARAYLKSFEASE